MCKYGQNEKSLLKNRLFGIESLSLAGTHAIKATNRDSINSTQNIPYYRKLSRFIYFFSLCFFIILLLLSFFKEYLRNEAKN